ncbi:MAG TPA: universal stress protein [Gemmatimonadales bacterium]|nr:universal stress protein [Gemmatimonadales bacterium]
MELQRILVAVKPGSAGTHVLRFAARLAAKTRARATAVSVTDASAPPTSAAPDHLNGMPLLTVAGVPAIEIARLAESTEADLIVLGRDLPAGRVTRDCGATVEGTVRRARVPCLLVPPGARAFHRFLVAVDGGPDSGDVIAAAHRLARAYNAAVQLVQVEEPVAAGVGALTGVDDGPAPANHDTLVCRGEPVSEILRVARDQVTDVVVLGHHRGGPVSPHATSGVASRLVQRVPCAVLTVPI